MTADSSHPIFEYQELDSLEEVNRLAREEGWDLMQAVATTAGLRFIVRRPQAAVGGRRAGFSVLPSE